MNQSRPWLDLLAQSTNYADLQNAFHQMEGEANSTNDPVALVQAIDEAIFRIEKERDRDNVELKNFTGDYEAFKAQHSGVFGWLKRKIPFTETRTKELEHRENVSEQQAEILADNFVIARAQMLKQRLLPSTLRSIGLRVPDWQSRLLTQRSISMIREFGNSVLELKKRSVRSSSFMNFWSMTSRHSPTHHSKASRTNQCGIRTLLMQVAN